MNALENVRAFHVELGDSTSVRKLARDVHNAMGPVDVLINNAGWGQRSAMEEAGEETVRTMFEVNAFAPLWLSQEVIPAMRAKGKGLIVNISSVTGVFSSPFGGIYAGTKHALEGWAESMRMEVESFGIDVVIVQLGPIATAFLPTSHKRSEAALKNPDSPVFACLRQLVGVGGPAS
ncbi:MAG: SDR family NAD(P)-dependent oxidoreductase [Deltaproteobacteria bacterium]|nr:SDR family NAD(P)-dependent oxidoreductase [Deltaproteobacteria bacterium]